MRVVNQRTAQPSYADPDLPQGNVATRYITPATYTAPPFVRDFSGSRLENSRGGAPFQGPVGLGRSDDQIEYDRAPGATNDQAIEKARGGYFRTPLYQSPGRGSENYSWTAAGPAPTMLNMRKMNYRPIVGGSHQSTWGMHTYMQVLPHDLAAKPSMRPGRQNRLTVQAYRGQSFSATTALQ